LTNYGNPDLSVGFWVPALSGSDTQKPSGAKDWELLKMSNGLTFRQLSISPGTDGTLITVAGSGEVLASLTGVAPNLIGSEDFISV
jgi:hypothetical protein